MILNDLPYEHELRNKPLIEIGAKYQIRDSKVLAEVTPPYGIAKKTYNQLGDVWTKWDIWHATIY
jgi:hypothetical protein